MVYVMQIKKRDLVKIEDLAIKIYYDTG